MRPALPLWFRSAQRRPATAAALVLVAALTLVTAVSAPLLLRAVEESGLETAVAEAGSGTDIVVAAHSDSYSATDNEQLRRDLAGSLSWIAGTAAPLKVLSEPVVTLQSADNIRWNAGRREGSARLLAQDETCRGFRITSGRCPASAAEVAVSDRLLDGQVRLHGKLLIKGPSQTDPVAYTVAGAFDPAASSGRLADLADETGALTARAQDPFLVTTSALAPFTDAVLISARDTVLPHRLDLDAIPAARASTTAVQRQVIASQVGAVSFVTHLPDVLDAAAADRQAAATLVFVAGSLGVALSLTSAAGIAALIARARSFEWALGRLRGLRRRSWLGVVFIEPIVLNLAGALIGCLAGWVWCSLALRLIVRQSLSPDLWRGPVLFAACVAAAGLVLTAVMASVAGARAPLASLLREGADPVRASRLAVAAECVVIVLALAAGGQLAVQDPLAGTAGTLALLAPGLIAAGLALIAVRMATGIVRRRARGPARSISTVLVTRSLARTPSVLQQQIPVAVGVALLVFATQSALLAARNQQLRADAQVGADTVLRVQLPAKADLRSVVRAADPSGVAAMAVQERNGSLDGNTSRVVAVDTSRLAAVSSWRARWAGLSPAQLAKLLHPQLLPPVVLRGQQVTVHLASASVVADASTADSLDEPAAASLVLVVARAQGDAAPWQRVNLGLLSFDHTSLHAAIPCATGCRLVRWELQKESPTPFDADLTISSLSTDIQPAAAFGPALGDPKGWRPVLGVPEPGAPPQTSATASAGGLHIQAVSYPGDVGSPAVTPADTPDPLPAIVAAGAQTAPVAGYPGTVAGTALDGDALLLKVVASTSVLPRSLADGVMVDLGYAAATADPAYAQTTSEVWVAHGAGDRVERALTGAGVRILGRERLASAAQELSRTTTGRAADAVLAIGAAAALLILILPISSRIIAADRRRSLWVAARLSGVRRRRLRRIVTAEIAGPAMVAALIGTVAALISLRLAGSRLPLFAAGTVGPPLDVRPGWIIVAAVTGGILACIVLIAAGCVALESARADSADRRDQDPQDTPARTDPAASGVTP